MARFPKPQSEVFSSEPYILLGVVLIVPSGPGIPKCQVGTLARLGEELRFVPKCQRFQPGVFCRRDEYEERKGEVGTLSPTATFLHN